MPTDSIAFVETHGQLILDPVVGEPLYGDLPGEDGDLYVTFVTEWKLQSSDGDTNHELGVAHDGHDGALDLVKKIIPNYHFADEYDGYSAAEEIREALGALDGGTIESPDGEVLFAYGYEGESVYWMYPSKFSILAYSKTGDITEPPGATFTDIHQALAKLVELASPNKQWIAKAANVKPGDKIVVNDAEVTVHHVEDRGDKFYVEYFHEGVEDEETYVTYLPKAASTPALTDVDCAGCQNAKVEEDSDGKSNELCQACHEALEDFEAQS